MSMMVPNAAVLPTPSTVLSLIVSCAENAEAPMPRLVEAAGLDPAIAARILRIANAEAGGIPRGMPSLPKAAAFLGCNRLRSLLLLSGRLNGGNGRLAQFFSPERFWRHSILVGKLAESIGRHQNGSLGIDEQELYAAGILHDIGKLALLVCDPLSVQKTLDCSIRTEQPFYKAEEAGLQHPVAAGALASVWHLPPQLKCAIACHHDPVGAGDYFRFCAVIHTADVIAHLVGCQVFENECAPPVNESALESIRLSAERLKTITETEIDALKEIEAARHIASGERIGSSGNTPAS